MRIISKFNDYYDSVQNQGFDKDCLYLRESKRIQIKSSFELGYRTQSGLIQVNYALLGFCGEIYYIVETYDMESGALDYGVYTKPQIIEKLKGKKKKYFFSLDRDLLFANQDESKLKELFHTHQAPLFLITRDKENSNIQNIDLNPSLKKLNFQKTKDPFTAYQEIYQYVSGVLNSPENKMVKLSDKDKIDKHGFDKWSFRKQSKEKKNEKKVKLLILQEYVRISPKIT
jgi:hypothetical protein